MKLRHLAIAFGLAAANVSAQDQQATEPAPAVETMPLEIVSAMPDGANVIIFRAYVEPTIWATTVKVDGTKLIALGNKQWTAVALEPGTYTLKTSWSIMSGQSGGNLQLTVEPGKVHFVEIVGQSQYAGGGAGYMTFRMGSGIGEIIGAGAAARVAACCEFKAPKF